MQTNQQNQTISRLWKISGSLDKKYYFRPLTVIMVAFWGYALFGMLSQYFSIESYHSFMNIIYSYSNGIFITILTVILLYINIRFYPWVAIMLSNLPFSNHIFKVDQPFLDSILDGYRKSKQSVDKKMPKISIQEYNVRRSTGDITHGRKQTNSFERNMELGFNILINYTFIPLIKFMVIFMVHTFSFILGLIAIPYTIKRIS